MIALTSRLNERDETIIQLQEELDAYDQITLDVETSAMQKQQRIDQLEQFVTETGYQVPENPFQTGSELQMINMSRKPTQVSVDFTEGDNSSSQNGLTSEQRQKKQA